MAIGLADGQVILHNLAVDKVVVKFKQEYGPVTGIGFRTGKSVDLWPVSSAWLLVFTKSITVIFA